MLKIILLSLLLTETISVQSQALTQRQACEKFSSSVVSIDAGGESRGSGFIVSQDGLILTASHVVRDPNGAFYSVISVKMPSGESVFATPVIAISAANVAQDYALLKVPTKQGLPFLTLGSIGDAVVGADATIIGYPFSAIDSQGRNISVKFCVAATFAAIGSEPEHVTGTTQTRNGPVPFQTDVQVDVVYFQGPSVKGISGSPIISRDTGKVVGIVSTKLSGIGNSLEELKTATAQGTGGGIIESGLAPGPAINEILTVMDNQLANGLGSATGIDDPKEALRKEQNKKK